MDHTSVQMWRLKTIVMFEYHTPIYPVIHGEGCLASRLYDMEICIMAKKKISELETGTKTLEELKKLCCLKSAQRESVTVCLEGDHYCNQQANRPPSDVKYLI